MDNTNISLDDLRAILEAKGLDIKELAKEAKELKLNSSLEDSINDDNNPRKTISKVQHAPVYELALVNYPDFVIRKSTAKTEKMMVIMISQNSYYIKTVKNGSEVKEPLDRDNYGAFTSGMKDIDLPDGFWIDKIEAGRTFFDKLERDFLDSAPLTEGIRKAIIGRYFDKCSSDICDWKTMYSKIPLLLKEKNFKHEYMQVWEFFYQIQEKFGIEKARDFLNELDRSLVNLRTNDCRYFYNELLQGYDFQFDTFMEYVLYDSVRLGYADNLSQFFSVWYDTLRMQKFFWGKIKDKYPQHLLEQHSSLSYKIRLEQQKIDRANFEERAHEARKFEARINDYVFIAPKEPQDFYDEATAQCNCLASYVQKYSNGEDYIFFMRKHNKPEESLVTIELDLNGNLRQAYQAHNRSVTKEQNEVIQKWLDTTVACEINKQAA